MNRLTLILLNIISIYTILISLIDLIRRYVCKISIIEFLFYIDSFLILMGGFLFGTIYILCLNSKGATLFGCILYIINIVNIFDLLKSVV